MKRRRFLKIGSILGVSLVTGIASAKGTSFFQEGETLSKNQLNDLLKQSDVVAYSKKSSNYNVAIKNIYPDLYQKNKIQHFNISSDNLYPFSLQQGDYAVQLRKMSNGFVIMNLFILSEKGYVLVGENIGNTKVENTNTMAWLKYGVKISISEHVT